MWRMIFIVEDFIVYLYSVAAWMSCGIGIASLYAENVDVAVTLHDYNYQILL